VANAVHHFWSNLLEKKEDYAAEAVKWAFPEGTDIRQAQNEVI